jgi:hypothetical protein
LHATWKCDKETRERQQLYNNYKDAAKDVGIDTCLTSIEGRIRGVLCNSIPSAYGFFLEYDDYEVIEGEVWKSVPTELVNAEGYQISTAARICDKLGKHYNGSLEKDSNYVRVCIKEKLFRLHILVAQVFIDNPDNKEHVNHKDGNRANNTVSNLEWATRSENMQHAYDIGLNNKTAKIKQYNIDGLLVLHTHLVMKQQEHLGLNGSK